MEEKDRDSYDSKYMKEAIRQAKKAVLIDEVPIGCVIVYQDRLSDVVITKEIKWAVHLHMQRSLRFRKQVKN